MYEAFYGLKLRPFALVPQAEFLYLTSQHRRALSLLEYGLMKPSLFSVVTGDVGTGKTILVRHLLRGLGESLAVGAISNTYAHFEELLQWTLAAFGMPHAGLDKVQMVQALARFLADQQGRGRRAVLFVDEAQNLTVEALEQLRMLSNLNVDWDHLLQILLTGQPALREKLRLPALRQFAQRVETDCHLQPLDANDVELYIGHRLKVAGRKKPGLFDRAACSEIHHLSGGVPRVVNLICDTALVYGFAMEKPVIDAGVIAEVQRDKQAQGGWLFQPEGADSVLPDGGTTRRNVAR